MKSLAPKAPPRKCLNMNQDELERADALNYGLEQATLADLQNALRALFIEAKEILPMLAHKARTESPTLWTLHDNLKKALIAAARCFTIPPEPGEQLRATKRLILQGRIQGLKKAREMYRNPGIGVEEAIDALIETLERS